MPRACSLLNSAEERFWKFVIRLGDDECWHWVGHVDKGGYGKFKVNGRTVRAHRFSFELMFGPVSEMLTIDHDCHNRALRHGSCKGGKKCLHRRCVNPIHMSAVPILDNVRNALKARRRFTEENYLE